MNFKIMSCTSSFYERQTGSHRLFDPEQDVYKTFLWFLFRCQDFCPLIVLFQYRRIIKIDVSYTCICDTVYCVITPILVAMKPTFSDKSYTLLMRLLSENHSVK